jgi:Beta-lactamase
MTIIAATANIVRSPRGIVAIEISDHPPFYYNETENSTSCQPRCGASSLNTRLVLKAAPAEGSPVSCCSGQPRLRLGHIKGGLIMLALNRISLVAFFALLYPVLSWAQSLGYANPEDVGFSQERLDRIADTINTDIAKGIIPGGTLLIARDGKIAYYKSFGWLDAAAKTPMPKDAIFRIYSMSKPITSVAAMILVEHGKLFLSDPVQKYIPAFADMKVAVQRPNAPEVDLVPATRPITVQDLMRHTSGLTYGFLPGTPVTKMYRLLRRICGRSTPWLIQSFCICC